MFKQKKNKLLIGLAVMVVAGLLGWIFVVDPTLDQRDKERFEEAEVFLGEIYQDKVLPIAEADEIRNERVCRYSGEKYGQGTLRCSVGTELFYTSDPVMTTEAIANELDLPLKDSRNSEVTTEDISTSEAFYVYQSIPQEKVGCGISYSNESNALINNYSLRIKLSCSDIARSEHFPVQ